MIGTSIGPYRVVRKLGAGGMGAVFEAVHRTIQHRVCIKVLHPEYAKNAEFAQRFFNEARAERNRRKIPPWRRPGMAREQTWEDS